MEKAETYSDEQLFQFMKAGDRKAFESIYKKYWAILFDNAYKRLKSKEGAEEIIQELFIYLWCKREDIQLNHTFSTYIHAALKYRTLNYLRSEFSKKKYVDFVKQTQLGFNDTVEETIAYNELNSLIEVEISNLPERCKEAFKLSRETNLSYKEIAETLDVSVNTVEKHIGKALKVLRTNLKDYISVVSLLCLLFL